MVLVVVVGLRRLAAERRRVGEPERSRQAAQRWAGYRPVDKLWPVYAAKA
jgi:hypothetical protein